MKKETQEDLLYTIEDAKRQINEANEKLKVLKDKAKNEYLDSYRKLCEVEDMPILRKKALDFWHGYNQDTFKKRVELL